MQREAGEEDLLERGAIPVVEVRREGGGGKEYLTRERGCSLFTPSQLVLDRIMSHLTAPARKVMPGMKYNILRFFM